MSLSDKYVWVFLLLGNVIVARAYWRGSSESRKENPRLEAGYRNVARGFLVFSSIPWLLMGVGLMTGAVPSFFDFLELRAANRFVLFWYASLVALWVILAFWIFLGGGAQMMADHPGLPGWLTGTPKQVKLTCILGLALGIGFILIVYFGSSQGGAP